MAFSDLKKKRSQDINKLVAEAEKLNGDAGQKSLGDDRFWKPTVDKSGNGYAVIRLLPAPDGEDLPWVRYWDHFFKGPTGLWYVEKSLTTIGQSDPVSEANSILWNTGRDEDKQTARDRKRRLHYVSNIYVISDPNNPETEGKVYLYRYGKKIFDKIMDIMQPEFQDEEPVNPFDFWEGADFKLKIRNVENFRNYDKSEFSNPSQLLGGDDGELEKIYGQAHSLAEFTNRDTFNPYDELKAKLNRVLNIGGETAPSNTRDQISLDESTPTPEPSKSARSSAFTAKEIDNDPAVSNNGESDDDDDTLSYFAKLAAQD